MSILSKKLKNQFDSIICNRALEYNLRYNNVFIQSDSSIRLSYKMHGSYTYNVELTFKKGDYEKSYVKGHCECPYFYENDECKHVWAAILNSNGTQFERFILASLLTPNEKLTYFSKFEEPFLDDFEDEDFDDESELFSLSYPTSNTKNNIVYQDTKEWLIESLKKQKESQTSLESKKSFSITSKAKHYKNIYYVLKEKSNYHSEIQIFFYYKNRLKNGDFSKLKPIKISSKSIDEIYDPFDRNMVFNLLSHSEMESYSYYSSYSYKQGDLELSTNSAQILLPSACEKEKLLYEKASGEMVLIKNAFNSNAKFQLKFSQNESKNSWVITPAWSIENQLVENKDIIFLNEREKNLIYYNQNLYKAEFFGLRSHYDSLSKQTLEFKEDEKDKLKDLVLQALPPGVCNFDDNFFIDQKTITPKPIFKVEMIEYQKLTQIIGSLGFNYEGELLEPLSEQTISDKDAILMRDFEFEKKMIAEISNLKGLKPFFENDEAFQWTIEDQDFILTVSQLSKLGVEVMALGKKVVSPTSFNSSVNPSGVDWFEVNVEANFNGANVTLPEILKGQFKNGFIQLGDGTLGILPTEWLEKQKALAKIGQLDGDELIVHKSHALFIEELLESHQAQFDKGFSELIQRLKNTQKIQPLNASKRFQGELRSYQKEALGWMQFLWEMGIGGCLADEMGLGKTIQILAYLDKGYGKKKDFLKTLIVAPKSLIFNWKNEAKKFTPQLSVGVYEGSPQEREDLLKSHNHHILLCTYGILKRDIEKFKDTHFNYVILDEAQAIKNANSKNAKACRLLKAQHRLALTGTPIENHQDDLFSIFNFLIPGMFAKKQATNSLEANDQIIKAIRPFILRRTKEEVLTDLPEKTESILYCDLSSDHKKIYTDLKEYYRLRLSQSADNESIKNNKLHVLEALLRLRQTACHPALVDTKYNTNRYGKFEVLISKLKEILDDNRKVLVYSQFVQLLKLLGEELKNEGLDYSYLDGQSRNREEIVQEFKQYNSKNIFLISLKAGGVGLNLTEADYCFILDPWWNPAVESQAIDRIHRIGQKNPVFAYKIIMKDTVEEKILDLQNKKLKLADDILSTKEGFLKQLKPEDLEYIFS